MRPTLRYVEAWLTASIMTTVFASLISSIRVIAALRDVGMSAAPLKISSMLGYDLVHFAPGYAVFIMISLGLAFIIVAYMDRRAGKARAWLYIVSGLAAIIVMLYFMQKAFFGVPFIAGARDGLGVILQGLCGGVGALIYCILSQKIEALNPPRDEAAEA